MGGGAQITSSVLFTSWGHRIVLLASTVIAVLSLGCRPRSEVEIQIRNDHRESIRGIHLYVPGAFSLVSPEGAELARGEACCLIRVETPKVISEPGRITWLEGSERREATVDLRPFFKEGLEEPGLSLEVVLRQDDEPVLVRKLPGP